MNEADKAKKMKEQVELLKKKYLNKNSCKQTLPISQPKPQKQVNVPMQDHPNISQVQPVAKQEKHQQIDKKDKNKAQELVKRSSSNQQAWSLKNMMEQGDQMPTITDNNKNTKQFYEIQSNQKDPFHLKTIAFKKQRSSGHEMHADAQFADFEQSQTHLSSASVQKPIRNIEMGQACKRWKKSSKQALSYLMFDDQILIRGGPYPKIVLSSTNPSFPGIVQNLAMQFIFKNMNPLNEQQKDVVFQMAINYFSPSPKVLSDVLLLCLIKIGPKCLKIYADQILTKIQYYFQRIFIYQRNHLLDQQVQNFVTFMAQKLQQKRREGDNIHIKWFIWLLMLKPSNVFLHQFLLAATFPNINSLFTVFCILEPVDTNIGLSLLYLRCVDELAPTFSQFHIIEDVIENFKKMKVPEPLYKPVKSLKLKLIRSADSSGVLKKPSEEEKGFMNYLNEKMGKLKGKLDSSMISKSTIELYFDRAVGEYRTGN